MKFFFYLFYIFIFVAMEIKQKRRRSRRRDSRRSDDENDSDQVEIETHELIGMYKDSFMVHISFPTLFGIKEDDGRLLLSFDSGGFISLLKTAQTTHGIPINGAGLTIL